MAGTGIILDTHSLVWYFDRDSRKKLSQMALKTIQEVEQTGTIYVSLITLFEILDLAEKGRISLEYKEVLLLLKKNTAYQIIPVTNEILDLAFPYEGLEIHDRIIVATAKFTDSVLVSKDTDIRNAGINVIW